jgi:hypothetical protein
MGRVDLDWEHDQIMENGTVHLTHYCKQHKLQKILAVKLVWESVVLNKIKLLTPYFSFPDSVLQ